MGEQSTIRKCEIVTNLEKDGRKLIDLENLESLLRSKKCIRDFAYIIHNKDTYSGTEEAKNPNHKAGTLKTPHIHLILRFQNNQPQKIKYVAKWFSLAPNFVSKIHGEWRDACLYLTHKNAPDRYQYPADEVIANFNYTEFLERDSNQANINSIIARIMDGELAEYNKTKEIDPFILVKYTQRIEEAFKLRAEYLQVTQKSRNTTCIFITGSSGVGKTTLARKIAEEKNLAYFVSSGSNDLLDGYRQEPCIILDDMRPSAMGLSDLLKMLDPHTASSVRSRYRNKYLNCELIILTTVLDINSFYQHVFSEQGEPIIQFQRRFQTYIKVFADKISVSTWDAAEMKYSDSVILNNSLLDEFISATSCSGKRTEEFIDEYMPFLESPTKRYLDEDFNEISRKEFIDRYKK